MPKAWTLKDVGKHWDETEDYEDINAETYSYFRRFTDSFRMADIKKPGLMLDISCRTGNGTLYYGQHIKKMQFVCADVSKKMLAIAKKKMKVEGKGKIKHKEVYFDKFPLPFDDNSFDYILCLETLEHICPPEQFVSELRRVLKPKGVLILSTPNDWWEFFHWFADVTHIHHGEGPHRMIPRKEILQMLKKNKLVIKKEETTVIIPIGPRFFTKFGEWFEKAFKSSLMPYLGLRRIFICEKK